MTNPHQSITTSLPTPFLGCPVWTHPSWPCKGLKDYARFCNSIEGNTTFYQTPTVARAQEWADAVSDDFRFSFKLPQIITHQLKLQNYQRELAEFWQTLTPLHDKIGVLMVQLPASFGPSMLPTLQRFIETYDLPVPLAVEVRHQQFFLKGDSEKALNRLLLDNGVNRVMLDSRGLFAHPATSEIEREVQSRKPRLPVNVIATDTHPVVRFIGGNDDEENVKAMMPWIKKCHQWRVEQRQPFLFFHRPDNADAPYLLAKFVDLYNQTYPNFPLNCDLSAVFPAQSQGALVF